MRVLTALLFLFISYGAGVYLSSRLHAESGPLTGYVVSPVVCTDPSDRALRATGEASVKLNRILLGYGDAAEGYNWSRKFVAPNGVDRMLNTINLLEPRPDSLIAPVQLWPPMEVSRNLGALMQASELEENLSNTLVSITNPALPVGTDLSHILAAASTSGLGDAGLLKSGESFEFLRSNSPIPIDLLKATPGESEIRYGEPPVPRYAPTLQRTLDCLLASVVPGKDNDTLKACAKLNANTIDTCFLPAVSLATREKLDTGSFEQTCSGTIIAKDFVLTAAHCVCEKNEIPIVFGNGISSLSTRYSMWETVPGTGPLLLSNAPKQLYRAWLRLKDSYVHDEGYASTIIRSISAPIYLDEDYCKDPRQGGKKDLALVKFNGGILGIVHKALIIPPPVRGTVVNAAGFGKDPTAMKQKILKRYASFQTGVESDGVISLLSGDGLKNTCTGDSGSGAYMRLIDGRLAIFGVLSGGVGGCDVSNPSQYSILWREDVKDFIKAHVSDAVFIENAEFANDMHVCIGVKCPNFITASR